MWEYTDKVKDHFLYPRNVGVIEHADGVGEVGSLACGDALKLTFKLDSDIELVDFVDNTVFVELLGICSSCSASQVTLKHYVETKIKELVSPELAVE